MHAILMLRLVLARLAFMAVAGLVLLTFLFCLFHAIPGDPARLIAGDSAPEELVESIRQAYGLDQPLMTQFTTYMGRVLRGDFGLSNFSRQPVLQIVGPRLLNTAKLAGWSMLLAMSLSLLLGSLSAMYWDRPLDRGITAFSLVGICTPIFVTGILAIYFFGVHLRWLPIGGMTTWKHYVMPVLTLGLAQAAGFTRMVRACMIDALGRDFITTARAKGVPERSIVFKHGLRNALLPIITFFGLGLGHLLGRRGRRGIDLQLAGPRTPDGGFDPDPRPAPDPGLHLLLRHGVHPGEPRGRSPLPLGRSEDRL